jgi:hypothetical protein
MEFSLRNVRMAGRLATAVFTVVASTTALLAFPPARTATQMAFDEQNGRAVLFGGISRPDSSQIRTYYGDTWEWTGRRWVQLHPGVSPPARAAAVMVYDSNRDRILLFGGDGAGNIALSDTWSYRNGQWSQIQTPSSPEPRRIPGAAFDPIRDRLVIFGGTGANAANLFDTWEFDGTTWRRINDNGPRLAAPLLVYDEARNEILMLGTTIVTGTAQPAVEMYRWDGSSWSKITPANLPPCVTQGRMVYQKHDGRVVQFGGICGFLGGNTWEWDGSDWIKNESRANPGSIFGHAMTYDTARLETILYGGTDFDIERSSTWRYRGGGAWAIGGESFVPGPRSLFVFEHDPATATNYLFGGHNDSAVYNDLWTFQDNRWLRIEAANGPVGCSYPNGAFDTDRGRLVILCQGGETYEFDGAEWHARNPSTKPPFRRFSEMVYDPTLKKSIMFGGYDLAGFYHNVTWIWDGNNWSKIDRKDNPPARILPTFFYDPIQRRTTVYGGVGRPDPKKAIARYDDMWAFNGSRWTQVNPTSKPGPVYGARTAFDPTRDRVVMFGGKNGLEQYINEQWEWDGTNWSRRDAANVPSPRMNGGFLFDTATSRLIWYGGFAGRHFAEVWSQTASGWQLVPEPSGRSRAAAPAPPSTPAGPAAMPPDYDPEPEPPARLRSRPAVRN